MLRWRRALAESDGVFIAAPEYALSLPGTLKKGIDWVIGAGELEGRVIAITAAVPAPELGAAACTRCAGTLSAVHAVIVGGEAIAKGPDFHERVARLIADLLQVVAHANGIQGSPGYRPEGLEVGCC